MDTLSISHKSISCHFWNAVKLDPVGSNLDHILPNSIIQWGATVTRT